MDKAVIVDAIRTPIGRYNGVLKDIRPDDLAAAVIAELVKRTPRLDISEIEDVIIGCANQAGEDNRNVARMASLLAGLPVTVAGGTVNRLCGSGLMALTDACMAIETGTGEIFIAGGTESMTRSPYALAKPEIAFPRGDQKLFDTTLGWRFVNKKLAEMYYPYSMGETAENVAVNYKIQRAQQDAYAFESQMRYKKAKEKGIYAQEIMPLSVQSAKKEAVKKVGSISEDEHPRPQITMADLEALRPAFREGGTVTAGNSSGINDGAAALLVMKQSKAEKLGLKPLARYVSSAVVGVDPAYMGIGPVPATKKVLKRANLSLSDIDLIELNEAFAAQVLACMLELNIDPGKLNVNGGAIAIGHPLGCSGARLATTLLYEMKRRHARYGLATMCIGVGQGIATIFENLS
jgi:3-oxoadipyl-CoA thiolase